MEPVIAKDVGKALREQRRLPTIALVAVVATLAVGTAIAYQPVLAAGMVFLFLLAIARSRESTVALWLGLRVLMFSGYVPVPLGEGMLVLITVVALARRAALGQPLRAPRSPVLWLLLLLLVGVNLAYFGLDPESLYYAREIFFENVLLVILIANTESRGVRDGAVTAVGLVLAGIGVVAGLEWATGRPLLLNPGRVAYADLAALQTFQGASRLGSVLLNPDLLGAAMALGFVLWTGIALEGRGFRRWLALIIAAGLLLVAFLTLSRTVFLGIPIGLGVLAIFALRKGRSSIGQATLAIAGIGVAIVAALVLVPEAWLRVTISPTDPLRIGAYETALKIMAAHPFVGLGAGWSRYLALAEAYRVPDQYIPLAHPHNSYLELGAMLGLPVAVVVVLLIGTAVVGAFRSWNANAISAVPIACVIAVAVMALAGQFITIPVLSNLFWALWAVAGQGTNQILRSKTPLRRTVL